MLLVDGDRLEPTGDRTVDHLEGYRPAREHEISRGERVKHGSTLGRRRAGRVRDNPNRLRVETRAAIERFLASPGLSAATRRSYRADLEEFGAWLRARRLSLEDVDTRTLTVYAAELGAARTGRKPRKLAQSTLSRKLAAVRSFLRQALGPARVPDLALGGGRARRLPHAPTTDETNVLLEHLDGNGPLAIRNRSALRADLLGRTALPGSGRPDACRCRLRARVPPCSRQGWKGASGTAGGAGLVLAAALSQGGQAGSRPEENRLPHPDSTPCRAWPRRRARVSVDPWAPSRHLNTPPPRPEPAPPATCLRDAPARRRRRPANHSGASRAFLALDDADLQPRRRTPTSEGL